MGRVPDDDDDTMLIIKRALPVAI